MNKTKDQTWPPEYYHMTCIGKTKGTSEKGLLWAAVTTIIKAFEIVRTIKVGSSVACEITQTLNN